VDRGRIEDITSLLRHFASLEPERIAIIDRGRPVTYGTLADGAGRLAAWLMARGVVPGETVATRGLSSLRELQVLLAIGRIGALVAALDAAAGAVEHGRVCAALGIRRMLADPDGAPLDGIETLSPPDPETLPPGSDGLPPGPPPSQPFLVIFSSGTTGRPKTLAVTQAAYLDRATRMIRPYALGPEDRLLSVVAMQSYTERMFCARMLAVGGRVVIAPLLDRLDALVELIRTEGITVVQLPPATIRRLLAAATEGAPPLGMLRILGYLGGPLHGGERAEVRRRLCANLYSNYGSNEVGCIAFLRPADFETRPAAVGRVVDAVTVEIVDEAGRPLPAGAVGEVRVRCPEMPTAYLGDPAATARSFRDGWFHPGDLARLDGDGFLTLVGRVDDMINLGGKKAHPEEIEAVLLTHPAVVEAAVFAAAAWPSGAVPVAAVVLREAVSEAALKAHCRARLARYKTPRRFFRLDALPRNSAGKVMRRSLAALTEERR